MPEATAVHRDACRRLVTGFGLNPGPVLRHVHEGLLAGASTDRLVAATAGGVGIGTGSPTRTDDRTGVVICAGAILAVEAAAHPHTAVNQSVVDLGSGKYMPTADATVSARARRSGGTIHREEPGGYSAQRQQVRLERHRRGQHPSIRWVVNG